LPGLADLQSLSADKRALLLDVGQFTLDIIGIFEPTPFADLTSGVVALFRTDYTSALISVAGVAPFVADAAKLGQVPRYTKTIERAIAVARTDSAFAAMLQPVLTRLATYLDRLPVERLTHGLREGLDHLRRKIDNYLGGMRAASRLDQLTDHVLRRLFGSTSNVGILPRQNVRTVLEFFDRHDVAGRNPAQ
jgi:hypothetical protein